MKKNVITFICLMFLLSCSGAFQDKENKEKDKIIHLSKDTYCFIDNKVNKIKCLTKDSTCFVYSVAADIRVKCQPLK